MTVGKKIKELRLKNEMTQEELARQLYVTRNAVSKWETDKGLPNMDSLILLSKIFDVSLDYLFGEEDIIKTTIDNKNKAEFNKNLLYGIIIFIVFAFIGTFVPYYLFKLDPSSLMATIYIILPMAYLLLGVVSVLSSTKLSYISISVALALVPIYVFFDIYLVNVPLGIWGLIYYIIFIGSYLLLSIILNIGFNEKRLKRLKTIFLVLSVLITIGFLTHTIYEVIMLLKCAWCSAPWYTALVVNLIIYIIPLTLSLTLYLYYKKKIQIKVIK